MDSAITWRKGSSLVGCWGVGGLSARFVSCISFEGGWVVCLRSLASGAIMGVEPRGPAPSGRNSCGGGFFGENPRSIGICNKV